MTRKLVHKTFPWILGLGVMTACGKHDSSSDKAGSASGSNDDLVKTQPANEKKEEISDSVNEQELSARFSEIRELLAKHALALNEQVEINKKLLDAQNELVKNSGQPNHVSDDLLNQIKAIALDLSEKNSLSNSEMAESLLRKIETLKSGTQMALSPFYKACVASINELDADSAQRRQVLNAIALTNTTKVARSVAVSREDFESVRNLPMSDNMHSGFVFIGTVDPLRESDLSYTHYAFTRLPSTQDYRVMSYRDLSVSEGGNRISGYRDENIQAFLRGDQNYLYQPVQSVELVSSQNPLYAIDANQIESYTVDDCERIATYMANVGSKTLTESIDEPAFRAYNTSSESNGTLESFGHSLRQFGKAGHVVSDVLAWLNNRWESVRSKELGRDYVDNDSKRIMVLQDNLMRKSSDGQIDYSFLDLINAPHLRFFAAVDSSIGISDKAYGESADFDNSYEGKHPSLVNFVQRHRTSDEPRKAKGYRELEAVFVNLKSADPIVENSPAPRPASNLFHVPY